MPSEHRFIVLRWDPAPRARRENGARLTFNMLAPLLLNLSSSYHCLRNLIKLQPLRSDVPKHYRLLRQSLRLIQVYSRNEDCGVLVRNAFIVYNLHHRRSIRLNGSTKLRSYTQDLFLNYIFYGTRINKYFNQSQCLVGAVVTRSTCTTCSEKELHVQFMLRSQVRFLY